MGILCFRFVDDVKIFFLVIFSAVKNWVVVISKGFSNTHKVCNILYFRKSMLHVKSRNIFFFAAAVRPIASGLYQQPKYNLFRDFFIK